MTRVAAAVACAMGWLTAAVHAAEAPENLIANGTLEQHTADAATGFEMAGSVAYGALGDARRDMATRGFALQSSGTSGGVACTIGGLDARAGRWFRFSFRGLPQRNFAVRNDDDLRIHIAFLGQAGRRYDGLTKAVYDQIETARRDLAANGRRKQNGAETWQTYQVDFRLPFPEIDRIKVGVAFEHGAAGGPENAAFLIDDVSLVRLPDPPAGPAAATRPAAVVPAGTLLPIAGRWSYAAAPGETTPPARFDHANAHRLLYFDGVHSAPFANNTTAWLRVGNANADGSAVAKDRLVENNVTIRFVPGAMAVHTRGVPNHPTGRYPEPGRGNPSPIGEQDATYYFPLEPKENPQHAVIDAQNTNGALHMGPIGLAANGVVFFNPFDMGSEDATDMMDRCCGHPNRDKQYHYHKYPVCVNTPWSDTGAGHSPVLGWAFDGLPLYGPYERAGVMARDVTGADALNAFNVHYDADRGWHYHVTPGRFPYLIGGFWGTEDARNRQRRGGPGGGPGTGRGGPPPGRRPPNE